MKSSKAKLVVIAIVLAAALAVLFTMYSRQVAERNELNEELYRAQILLTGLGVQKTTLEDELAEARASLDTYRAGFPTVTETIEYGDDLFEIADDCSVSISVVTASPSGEEKIGGVTYSVSSFTLAVSGTTENILRFIYALRTGDDFQLPWSADVKSVTMDAVRSAASINLDIYSYKG